MNRQTIKIAKRDNFVWKIITTREAIGIMKTDLFSLYVLYEDDTESLILNMDELKGYLKKDLPIAIEVGFTN